MVTGVTLLLVEVREIFLLRCHQYGKTWKTSAYFETIGDGQVNC